MGNSPTCRFALCPQHQATRSIFDYFVPNESEAETITGTQGKSLNQVAIEALARGAGLSERRCRQRDLRDIAGRDSVLGSALAAQDTADGEL